MLSALAIVGTTPHEGPGPPASRRDALEQALAEAERRLQRVLEDARSAARASATLQGAEHDARKLLELLQAKTKSLREMLHSLEADAVAVEKNLAERARQLEVAAESKSETLRGLRLDLEQLRHRIEATRGRHEQAPDEPEAK